MRHQLHYNIKTLCNAKISDDNNKFGVRQKEYTRIIQGRTREIKTHQKGQRGVNHIQSSDKLPNAVPQRATTPHSTPLPPEEIYALPRPLF